MKVQWRTEKNMVLASTFLPQTSCPFCRICYKTSQKSCKVEKGKEHRQQKTISYSQSTCNISFNTWELLQTYYRVYHWNWKSRSNLSIKRSTKSSIKVLLFYLHERINAPESLEMLKIWITTKTWKIQTFNIR